MRTISYNEANREFLPSLFTAYKKLTDEDLEVQILLVSHDSANTACRGYFETARTAQDALWLLRGAREYEFCPRCGGKNDCHGLASIRMSVEVTVVT